MRGESPQLDDLIAAKDMLYDRAVGRRNPGVYAYYASTGNYDKPTRIERLIASTVSQLADLNIFDNGRIQIEMVGAKELQRLYRAASSSVEVDIDFPRNVVLPTHGSVEEAYIGYLTASELLKIVTLKDENGALTEINKAVFFDNIRDFDPDSKINIEISETLSRGEGQDFIFRNNGITVVSKYIDRTGDRFRIEDYQIVNGCQTSNIIYNNRSNIDGVNIPFRLIGTKDDEFISSIIAGTNRQNAVREEQFWALRPFMKSFEEYCRSLDEDHRIFFERRENQFRGQKVEKARVVQPSALLKAVAATLLHQPNRSARDYRGISAEYQNRLFQDSHDVRLYYAACYLHYKLEFLWRNQRIDNGLKIFRYYLMTGIGKLTGGSGDIFSKRRSDIEAFSDRMVKLCDDETKLKQHILDISAILEKRIKAMAIETRERLRDTIRSESFAKSFEGDLSDVLLKD